MPSVIAPYQCVLLTATKDDALIDYAQKLANMLAVMQLEDELILMIVGILILDLK